MGADRERVREKQKDEIIHRTELPGEVVYEAVYAEREHELRRSTAQLALSGLAVQPDFASLVWRGIVAGLIALMIWLLLFAESARVWVIIILSLLVGLARLAYVIAGSRKRSIWSLRATFHL